LLLFLSFFGKEVQNIAGEEWQKVTNKDGEKEKK
jgi:hypothetical protein